MVQVITLKILVKRTAIAFMMLKLSYVSSVECRKPLVRARAVRDNIAAEPVVSSILASNTRQSPCMLKGDKSHA